MTKRRGISAAEKYAELESAGLERPRCECHGEPMKWHKTIRLQKGGKWDCVVMARDSVRRIYEENPEPNRERSRQWYENNRERALDASRQWRLNLASEQYARILLQSRRYKALRRKDARHNIKEREF